MKEAYLIKDITEYGKFMAYCMEHDFKVWRVYWDEREKGNHCYTVETDKWNDQRVWHSDISFYKSNGYKIVIPKFDFDKFGKITIVGKEEV